MNDFNKISSKSTSTLSSKPISFKKTDPQQYRSLTDRSGPVSVDSFNINTSDPWFIPSKLSQNTTSSSSTKQQPAIIQFSVEPQPQSKALDISLTPLSLASSTPEITYYNELNTFLAENTPISLVFATLRDILTNYNDEIDFKVDMTQQRIEGVVFISNQCVTFLIYVWQDKNNAKNTRFEFRRTSGDALAAGQLWTHIQSMYTTGNKNENESFIALTCDLPCLPPLEFQTSMDVDTDDDEADFIDFDSILECLIENDAYVVDELSILLENLNENDDLCRKLLAHHGFVSHLLNHSVKNQDISVARLALLILARLAGFQKENWLKNSKFVQNLVENVLNHKYGLLQKHGLRLLACLASNDMMIAQNHRFLISQCLQRFKNEKSLQNEMAKMMQFFAIH